jgi:prefoldin alpha subunit
MAEDKTEIYVEYQMVNQQLQELQRRIQEITNQLNELQITRVAVEEIPKTEKGTEILSPLAPGIFIKARLEDNSEFHINVGSNTVVLKSADDTKKLLSEQEAEIQKVEEQLAMQWQVLVMKLHEIQDKLKNV